MYDVEKLVSLVCELFDAEAEGKKYNLEVRKNKGYSPDAYLWVSTLGGSEAYRLGELAERSRQIGWSLATVCDMLDINQDGKAAEAPGRIRYERSDRRAYQRDSAGRGYYFLTGGQHGIFCEQWTEDRVGAGRARRPGESHRLGSTP